MSDPLSKRGVFGFIRIPGSSPKAVLLLPVFFIFTMFCIPGCGGSDPKADCPTKTKEKWDTFLKINYGSTEKEIEKQLGAFTNGFYTPDSASFVYYFGRLKYVPISVWVDAKTGIVQNVIIEVVSGMENFENDLKTAVEEYGLDGCELIYMGMKRDEVEEVFGKPDEDLLLEGGIQSIAYYSPHNDQIISFKFFPEQDNVCSIIEVYWFYR